MKRQGLGEVEGLGVPRNPSADGVGGASGSENDVRRSRHGALIGCHCAFLLMSWEKGQRSGAAATGMEALSARGKADAVA